MSSYVADEQTAHVIHAGRIGPGRDVSAGIAVVHSAVLAVVSAAVVGDGDGETTPAVMYYLIFWGYLLAAIGVMLLWYWWECENESRFDREQRYKRTHWIPVHWWER
jgi:hypothetical protein